MTYNERWRDWQNYLDLADDIIADLKEPQQFKRQYKKPRGAMDIGDKREELAKLLAKSEMIYDYALADWRTRQDPDRPKPRLEDNMEPAEAAPTSEDGPGDRVETYLGIDDFAEYVQPPEWGDDWDTYYAENWARSQGQQGKARMKAYKADDTPDVPVTPLHPVYRLVERWWLEELGEPSFSPKYPVTSAEVRPDKPKPKEYAGNEEWYKVDLKDYESHRTVTLRRTWQDWEYYNAPGRLLLSVVKMLDERYTAATCNGLWETIRKARRTAKK